MDAARQLAQLLQGAGQLVARGVEHGARGAVRVRLQAALGQPELQRERDQALLGAVVQVALQAPALEHRDLDDPRARGLQLVEAGAQLGLQALVLQRQRGGGGDRAHEPGLVGQRGVVDDRADADALALDLGRPRGRSPPRAARPGARRR